MHAKIVFPLLCALWAMGQAQPATWQPKPVPQVQAVPEPYHQVSFQRAGKELARYHFGPDLRRPFVYPLIGPSGRALTRMGHPHDAESHSHHNSAWVAHHDVDGVSFWDDRGKGRILHRTLDRLEDGRDSAAVLTTSDWVDDQGRVLLRERRRTAVVLLADQERFLLVDLQLAADTKPATLGKTPFGLFAVRMAKSLGVNDGGGMIRNSVGGMNEKGVFWKPARWMDYSGAVADGVIEGITLMDHPANPNHPSVFHVRDDGWMGSSLTFDAPRVIEPGKPLALRYALYVHRGAPTPAQIDRQWTAYSKLPTVEFGPAKK
jgi:hypothetical protein